MYLVEERPDDDLWKDKAYFGYPDEVISTPDVIDNLKKNHHHRVDYPAVIRARVFDLLIGDWDRHDDQWRWGMHKKGDLKMYYPIPRDRDQAFSKYDGIMYGFAREVSPAARPLREFKPKQNKIHWSNFGSRHFDATFLVGADWPVWQDAINYIKTNVTDEVIEDAFRSTLPPALFAIDGPELIEKVKGRRDNLASLARDFYEYRSKKVDITGTDKKDLFEIECFGEDIFKISVYDTNKRGEKENLTFERSFTADVTRELRLYGLQGDDIFRISGTNGKGLKVRIIGGLGEDKVETMSSGNRENVIIYDAKKEPIHVGDTRKVTMRLSNDPKYNTYDRMAKDYDPDYASFFPSVGFNPDDGVLLGVAPVFVSHGFKKSPYASQHALSFNYALGTSGFAFSYQGTFREVLGKNDLRLDAEVRTPLYSYNFYGLGNETVNKEDELGLDYNRVRQRYIRFAPAWSRRLGSSSTFSLGPTFESHRINLEGDRLIDELAPEFNDYIFEGAEYLGADLQFAFKNWDDNVFPRHGMGFNLNAGWKFSLDDQNSNFQFIQTELSLYQQLDRRGRWVVATRVGGMHIFNNKYEFFQGATLGGVGPNSNIRGFRRERFTGKSSFYQNVDLRWKFITSRSNSFPFSMGIYGGFDHGRVWIKEEDSDLWHYSVGGGAWASPLDLFQLNVGMFWGDGEEQRFMFGGSFFF